MVEIKIAQIVEEIVASGQSPDQGNPNLIVDKNIIKSCRRCQSVENYIRPKARTCIKCISKVNNERLKQKNYYKAYYESNKNDILQKSKEYYEEHTEEKKAKVKAYILSKKPSDYVPKPTRGRPKKITDIII